MRLFNKLPWLALALAAGPAFAQEATEAAPAEAVAEVVSNINSGDTAWMLTSSLLVLFMILPGLALFYGGLVRAKNMLSVLMQCTIITVGGDGDLRALRLLDVVRRLGERVLGRPRPRASSRASPRLRRRARSRSWSSSPSR